MLLTRLIGIALSHTNQKDFSLPLHLYRTAIRQASTLPTAQRASPSFLEWTEIALSHSALTTYRCWLENNSPTIPLPPSTTCRITPRKHEKARPEWKTDAEQAHPPTPGPSTPNLPSTPEIGIALSKTLADETTVASAFKGFHNFVIDLPGQTQPTLTTPSRGSDLQKDEERREVYRHYFRFLSTLLLPTHHPDSPSPRNLPSGSPAQNGSTISIVHSPATLAFTAKAGTKSQLRTELKLVQAIYEAYLTQSLSFPSAADFHELIGEFVDVIAINWRASGANGSDAEGVVEILYRAATKTFHSPRILRHLFYTLTSMGNLADAVLALETYLDLSENAKERIMKGKIEKDFDPDGTVLMTAAEGVRMVCKYVGDGKKGLKIAKRINEWIEKWRVGNKEVSAFVYRGIGTANATWARQTMTGENREDLLKAAETAFLRGLEYDAKDVDAWYGLALVQADLMDVHTAVESLGKGLAALGSSPPSSMDEGYTSRATPLLHALSLLLSAREEYEAATAACTTGLTLLSSYGDPTSLTIEMKETALQLQMTLMALSEATLGSEVAVGMSEQLLSLYTRLFPPPLRAAEDIGLNPPPTMTVTLTRPSTASRISRILTGKNMRQYDKEYSVSAYDLANSETSCLPPRPGTGKLARLATENGSIGMVGSQTTRVRGKKDHTSLRIAPRIKVSHTDPVVAVDPMLPGVAPQAKKTRRFSVSGGTIRRSKSVKSVKSSASSSTVAGDPTPPIPSTPGTSAGVSFAASRERTPNGSAFGSLGGYDSPGNLGEGVMFTILKRKLDSHQAVYRNGHFPTPPMTTGGSRSPVDSIREENSNGVEGSPRKMNILSNLPQKQLPYLLAALGDQATDQGVVRTVKRPWMLPEPTLKAEDEKRRTDIALRTVWLCVCGLYRRCGWLGDARGALEEAGTGAGVSGAASKEGEADVCVERGLLALEIGDRRAAVELFERALAVDVDHAGAIVALSQILLDIVPSPVSPCLTLQKIPSDRPKLPTQLQTKEENETDFMIRQNRVLGLLMACTSSSRGWDCSEAWHALAELLERQGDTDGAKKALWKVVGLEDGRGVRMLAAGAGVRIL